MSEAIDVNEMRRLLTQIAKLVLQSVALLDRASAQPIADRAADPQ